MIIGSLPFDGLRAHHIAVSVFFAVSISRVLNPLVMMLLERNKSEKAMRSIPRVAICREALRSVTSVTIIDKHG